MSAPLISVILPVYNAELYLRESIDSILRQTISDFEFIIINDGSRDRSGEIIRSYHDPRIIYVEQANAGLAATLNKGISMARGEFIARQDNDDISLPERFAKQIAYMRMHPETALLGTAAEIVDEKGRATGRFHDHPQGPWQLKFALIFNNPFVHSSVMIRRSVLEKSGGYSTSVSVFEDHNLWSRIARVSGLANLGERLLFYREVKTGMSRSTEDYMQRVKNQCLANLLFYCPQLDPQDAERCARLILGLEDAGSYRKSLALMRRVMNGLAESFAAKEQVRPELVKTEALKQVFAFRRHHYNKLIESPVTGKLEKLSAKISRKIMFMTNKLYF